MKIIRATTGEPIKVSDDDFENLNLYSWKVNDNGYAAFGKFLMHHLVLRRRGIQWKEIVDHKDRDKLNNQFENLRPASVAQNFLNTKRKSKTGFKGVTCTGKKFAAIISFKFKELRIGKFLTAEDAARAYDDLARILHGEFACLNFPHALSCQDAVASDTKGKVSH